MLFYRGIFQNLTWNRLIRHQLIYVNQHNRRQIHNDSVGCSHQLACSKNDVITHNDHIQQLQNDEPLQPNSSEFKTKKVLPFEAIPCAEKPHSYGTLPRLIYRCRQLLTAKWGNKFHEEIDECHRRLGPIFRKSLGHNQSAIFVQSPELLRDVFTYEGKYPKHPLPEAWTFYNQLYNCQRGLFFMDDVEWLETRKLLAPLMLRNDHRFLAAIECATDDLIDNWKQIAVNRQEFIELPQPLTTLYAWSIRVLICIMFGSAGQNICSELRATIDHFAQIVQNVFENTVPFTSISPQLAYNLHLPIWTKFANSVTDTLSIASKIVDFGLQQSEVDGLLSEMKDLGMSIEMIKRIFIDLITAAGDTTAFSIQWALFLLSNNQQKQELIRHELLTSVNKLDTPLIRGTVRETLRLYPVATFIGRILGKDAILSNYNVDKHTLVLISMYSAGRDEISFPNANTFEPNRWVRDPITGTLKFVNRPQSSIPYAMGARNCIGQRIANAQMHMILSKVLRTFKVQLLNANEIDIVMRLVIMPNKPMRFAVKRID